MSLDEIKGVRWQCKDCGVALSFQLDQAVRLPTACPSCNATFGDDDTIQAVKTMQVFVDALKRARMAYRGDFLRLEFVDKGI